MSWMCTAVPGWPRPPLPSATPVPQTCRTLRRSWQVVNLIINLVCYSFGFFYFTPHQTFLSLFLHRRSFDLYRICTSVSFNDKSIWITSVADMLHRSFLALWCYSQGLKWTTALRGKKLQVIPRSEYFWIIYNMYNFFPPAFSHFNRRRFPFHSFYVEVHTRSPSQGSWSHWE